eukprot:COSAG01_NODE_4122_length_5331_cov_11.476873_7_plen_260_part_00
MNREGRLLHKEKSHGWGLSVSRHFHPLRRLLVEKFAKMSTFPTANGLVRVDIGLSYANVELCNNTDTTEDCQRYYEQFAKSPLSLREMAQCRYLLSMQGNDVATNLKWLLYSNSVVLMQRPNIESWVLEGMLREWVHYVPLRSDLSDLEDNIRWCEANPAAAAQIAVSTMQFTTPRVTFAQKCRTDSLTCFVACIHQHAGRTHIMWLLNMNPAAENRVLAAVVDYTARRLGHKLGKSSEWHTSARLRNSYLLSHGPTWR